MIEKTLNNGIRIVMEQISHVRSASVGVWIKAGSVNESPDIAGISHFIEHMLFKGTAKRSAFDIAEELEKYGSSVNAFTGKEATCYYVKSLDNRIDVSIDVLCDMYLNSVFSEVEIDREKSVVLEEIKMIEDTPDDLILDMVSTLVYNEAAPIGRPVIGTSDSVSGITRDDIISYMENYYTVENTVISISGNFDVEKTMLLLEDSFGKKQSKKVVVPEVSSFDSYRTSYSNIKKDIEQVHIALCTRGVPANAKDFFAQSVYSAILGGGMSSRLFQNVRETKGLAYSVFSFNASYVSCGEFCIYAGVSGEKIKEALAAISEELISIANGISAEELLKAKERYKANIIFSTENIGSRMMSMGRSMLLLGEYKTDEQIIELIDAVTVEDINRIANKYSDIKSFSGILLGKDDFDTQSLILEME